MTSDLTIEIFLWQKQQICGPPDQVHEKQDVTQMNKIYLITVWVTVNSKAS